MGHLVLHALGWVDTGEDDALLESGIETAMLGRREPDEVSGSVVSCDAVEVVAFEVIRRISMPGEGDGDVDEDVAVVLPEFEIDLLASAIGFRAGIVCDGWFELIEVAPAEREDPPVGTTKEWSEGRSLERNESHFSSVG